MMFADAEDIESDLVGEFDLGEQIAHAFRRADARDTRWRAHRRETVDTKLDHDVPFAVRSGRNAPRSCTMRINQSATAIAAGAKPAGAMNAWKRTMLTMTGPRI